MRRPAPSILFRSVVAILVLIGILAVTGRTLVVSKVTWPYEVRNQLFPRIVGPEVNQYDRGFETHRALTLLHIIPAAIFLMLAPFQFSPGLRSRNIRFHQACGRIVLVSALTSGVAALALAIPFRFTGVTASSATVLFGVLFLICLVLAFAAIRKGDQLRHRKWMIRAFAIGIGISTIRVIGTLLFIFTDIKPFDLLGYSFWSGWILTILAGEIRIRRNHLALHTQAEVAGV